MKVFTKNTFKKQTATNFSLTVLLAFLLSIVSTNAVKAQFSIAASATNYSENFNSLTSGAWANNSTLTGWYARTDNTASITTYGAGTGTTTTAGLYAFGVAGTNPLTDRALGYYASNGFTGTSATGKGYIGWRLKNNTGSALTSITVTWTGEQWRRDNASAQTLLLFYRQASTVTDLTTGTYTSAGSSFSSPQLSATALALDGNTSANRSAGISVTITVNIPAGEEIMLRWEDLNDSGNDHTLAIDDITVSAVGAPAAPTVTTTTATSITTTSASSGGNVTSIGSASVTARGVAYGTGTGPTIGGTATNEGAGGTGTFTSSLSSLSINTQYFYRAYATNIVNTSYGAESSFYTLANTPGTVLVNNATTSSVDVTLAANSNPGATEFAIQETISGNYVQAGGTLGASAVWQTAAAWGTKTVTALAINSNHTFQVKARNGANTETAFGGSASLYTLANTPAAPTVNNATATTLDLAVNANSNPGNTEFAIQETGSSSYVQANGSLGGSAVWQTAATWATKTVTGLSPTTSYTFQVKARNGNAVETAFSGTAGGTTLSASSPILSATAITAFGAVCINTTTTANTFTISGTNLTTANVTVDALSGYSFSTDDITYNASLSIVQGGGTFSQLIYVKFTPVSVITYNGSLSIGGGGATGITAAVSGSGINTAPTVTAGAATGITATGATVPGTITATGCSAISAYGVEYSTTASFANGTGTPAAGSNLSGSNFSVSLSSLSTGTTYYYHTYATNNGGTAYSAEGNFATLTPTLSVSTLAAFGSVCTGITTAANSFTITGSNLNTADVTVAALSGFTYSTDDITYTTSLNLPQPSGAFSQLVYVKFSPTLVQSYNANIIVAGGGASAINRSVTATGINTPAAVTTGSAGSITQVSAIVTGSYTTGCSAVTAYGIEYSTTNGFANGSGTPVSSTNQSGGSFSASIASLSPGTTYYFKAFATDNSGTAYGAQQSFATAGLDAPVATAATAINSNSFTANWDAAANASGYRLDVSTSSTFTSSNATDLFFSEYVEGSGNNKYIEIYNGTGASVNLSNYKLQLFINGGSTATNDITLSGTLANGATIVYRNASASTYAGTSTSNAAVNFNGNDAIALYKISTAAFVDIFGSIGNNPGAAWTNGTFSTLDKTLVRKSGVSGGLTTNPASTFPTLGTEWNQSNVDIVTNLGSHTYTASNPSFVPGYNNLAVTGTSQAVTGLAAGTTYYYRVRATSTNSISANSNVISAATCTDLPVSVSIASNAGTSFCTGTAVTFTATPTNGGSSPTYQWFNGASAISGETAVTYSSSTLVNGDAISVVLTSSETCTSGNPATSNTITVTVNPILPVSVSIAASTGTTICAGTSVTFTATPTNGGVTPAYQWFNGASAISGQTAATYTSSTLVNGDDISVQLTSSEACQSGGPATSNNIVITVTPQLPVSVSIASSTSTTICAGTAVTFTATPTNGGSSPTYQWFNGASAISGETAATYSSSTLVNGDAISVVLTSSETCTSGNPATSNSIVMTVNPTIPVSVSIAANPGNAICPGTSVTFTATPTNGGSAPAYQWYNGATAITGETAATYTSATLVNGDAISVQLTSDVNPCATGNPATSNVIAITVYTLPTTPGAISGPVDACPLIGQLTPTTYSINAVIGAASYEWTIPVGTTLVSGQGTTSIDVTFDNSFALTNSQFKVRTVSAEGCKSVASSLIVSKNIPGIPVAISGPTNVCPFIGQATNATYSVAAVQYATSYNWVVPNGATIVSGQGSTSIDISFTGAFTSGSIKVTAVANCGSRSARSLTISKLQPTAPVAITGPSDACPYIGNSTPVQYSTAAVANADSYTWTVPANVNLISGQGSTTITVTFNTGYVTSLFKVKSVSNCFTSGDRTLSVAATTYAAPGVISGPTSACSYIGTALQATYTVRKVSGAPAYQWTVPTGVSIVSHPGGSGVNDTSIVVTFNNSFVNNSSIAVQTTGCYTSAASTLTISRVAATSTPGLVTGPTNACEYMVSANNPSGLPATYTIRKINNATSYAWTAPNNASITAHPGGTGVNDTIVQITYNSNFVSGTLTVASSNGCGFSNTRSLAVSKLNPGAPGGIDIIQTEVCPARQYTYSLAALPSNATSILWTVPAAGTVVSGQGTKTITVSYTAAAVAGTVTATAYNNCSNSATRSITIKLPACPPPAFTKGTLVEEVQQPLSAALKANISPNPSTTNFNLTVVTAGKEKATVRVMDLQGRQIQQFVVIPFASVKFGNNLKAGTYFVEVKQGNQKTTQRVMKF